MNEGIRNDVDTSPSSGVQIYFQLGEKWKTNKRLAIGAIESFVRLQRETFFSHDMRIDGMEISNEAIVGRKRLLRIHKAKKGFEWTRDVTVRNSWDLKRKETLCG